MFISAAAAFVLAVVVVVVFVVIVVVVVDVVILVVVVVVGVEAKIDADNCFRNILLFPLITSSHGAGWEEIGNLAYITGRGSAGGGS